MRCKPYTDLVEAMFAESGNAQFDTVTRQDFEEYQLIKQKKSKLSSNQRKMIVDKVERMIAKGDDYD